MKKEIKYFLLGALASFTGVALAQSWSVFSGVRLSQNGTELTPGYSWNSDQNSGLMRYGTDDIALLVGGAAANTGYLNLTALGVDIVGGDIDITSEDGDINLTPVASAGIVLDGDVTITGTCTGCGGGGVSYPLLAPSGAFTDPSYSFSNDATSGMYWNTAVNAAGLVNTDGTDLTSQFLVYDEKAVMYSDSSVSGDVAVWQLEPINGLSFSISGVSAVLHWDETGILTPNITANEPGYKGVPVLSQSVDYTLDLGDNAYQILHPSGAGAGDTFTFPLESGPTFPVGSVVTFTNLDPNDLEITTSGPSVTLAATTDTAPCNLAQNGVATALKVAVNTWIINGAGITCP